MQSSDWGSETLTEQQVNYAASDVLYLHKIKEELDKILINRQKMEEEYSRWTSQMRASFSATRFGHFVSVCAAFERNWRLAFGRNCVAQ